MATVITIPLTKDVLKSNIKAVIPFATEIDPVTSAADLSLDNYCDATIKTFTDNMYSNTKSRLDALETDFNSVLIALGALATALAAIPITAAAGTALSTALAPVLTNIPTRTTTRSVQEALPVPYLDGSK